MTQGRMRKKIRSAMVEIYNPQRQDSCKVIEWSTRGRRVRARAWKFHHVPNHRRECSYPSRGKMDIVFPACVCYEALLTYVYVALAITDR